MAKLHGLFKNYTTRIVSTAKFRENYTILAIIILHFSACTYFCCDGKIAEKKITFGTQRSGEIRSIVHRWERNFCCNAAFYDVPHGARSTETSARTFFSGLDLRGSFLHCTKACLVKGGLCQGTPFEGFALRKVIWGRKLRVTPRESPRANFHVVRIFVR